jgi:hypothetical protein
MAVTTQRDTLERYNPESNIVEIQGTDSITFIKGAMAAVVIATGKLTIGAVTAGLRGIGRLEENYVTGASNTRKIKVKTGTFKWKNSGASPVVQADLGKFVFIEDNETVKHTVGTAGIAGVVFELDADGGVWVTSKHTDSVAAATA